MSDSINFNSSAYCKIILHSAKFPHCAVNGILLAKPSSSKEITFEDAVPLFHIDHNLTPMAEIALAQIDELVSKKGLCIAGYYVAHENLKENSLEKAECKISDKISTHFNHPCIVVVDNTKLGMYIDNVALKVAQYSDGAYRPCDMHRICLVPEKTMDVCSQLLEDGKQDLLNDFDNHLDNVKLDWLNPELDKEIEKLL
ncbi:hypothetical protein WA026_013061 [Henosepilachna vigintioctopunctata]|uniref:MPN domain-containing protein n=1 Tax=Henosepilachna vigintioctopunctata TaxID=420089 RepID=A0AAW1UAJ7_9CUCU